MQANPHQLLEGLIICGYAIDAEIGYLFLRWAYLGSAKSLMGAVREAYEKGYLGRNILGSGFSMDIKMHTSAGRYICGEETALLNALGGSEGHTQVQAALSLLNAASGAGRPL